MKRLLLAAAVATLAGCGHDDAAKRTAPVKERVRQASRAASRDIERIRRSKLPKDAQKQLEEAQKELDAQP